MTNSLFILQSCDYYVLYISKLEEVVCLMIEEQVFAKLLTHLSLVND